MNENKEWELEKQRIREIVDEAVMKISEHVDAVQVIVTHHCAEVDRNMSYEKGSGNFHARLGAVMEWMDIHRQYIKNWAIRKDEEGEDDDEQS